VFQTTQQLSYSHVQLLTLGRWAIASKLHMRDLSDYPLQITNCSRRPRNCV